MFLYTFTLVGEIDTCTLLQWYIRYRRSHGKQITQLKDAVNEDVCVGC